VALTDAVRRAAESIRKALEGLPLDVWSSPLGRARETSQLAGFPTAHIDHDLCEWDYGVYEGRTTLEIREEIPAWSVWLSPIPDGESLDQVSTRARRVIDRVTESAARKVAVRSRSLPKDSCRLLVGMSPLTGRFLALDTATISILGYERRRVSSAAGMLAVYCELLPRRRPQPFQIRAV
jgi:broad specificity phosphatase PhoE